MRAPTEQLFAAWASHGFNELNSQRVRGRRGITGLVFHKASRKSVAGSSGAAQGRESLQRIVRRTPQVMVRISGGGRSMRQIRAHLGYITRNGQLPGVDQCGDVVRGVDEVDDFANELQWGGFPIDDTDRKHAFNIILSMPEGTDSGAVRRAAAEFAADEFEGHQYLMVLHSYDTDTNRDPARHPHVHVCVKAVGEDGIRLNPRKHDLQRWRDKFAERLREHGVDAAASSRLERLQPQRGVKQSVGHMVARDERTHSIGTQRTSLTRVARARRLEKIMVDRYAAVARSLATSVDGHDRQMAVDIVTAVAERVTPDRTFHPDRAKATRER